MDRDPELRELVLNQLKMGWSPEQIAGRQAHNKAAIRISYESIYRFIHRQIRRHKDYSWRHYLPRGKGQRGDGCNPEGQSPSVILAHSNALGNRSLFEHNNL